MPLRRYVQMSKRQCKEIYPIHLLPCSKLEILTIENTCTLHSSIWIKNKIIDLLSVIRNWHIYESPLPQTMLKQITYPTTP
jgi:hypothetical protein